MSEKVLIVDDEDANFRLLTQWLIREGYDIELVPQTGKRRCGRS